MAYEIVLSPEAVDDLQELKAHVRTTIRAALAKYLRHQPTRVSQSRIKRLRQLRTPQYRLRVDDIRVFYDVDGSTVTVLAIVDKPSADAWLRTFGEFEEEQDDEADTAV